jgi:putative ABC transport system permease protein
MTLLLLIRRSLRQHALSTVITALSIALAAGLWATVWTLQSQSQRAFLGAQAGVDGVLGARGSKLQLVLNAVFHLENSPGNLAWVDFEEIKAQPGVDWAVPLAVGDNYQGYPLVGTTLDLFQRVRRGSEALYRLAAASRWFEMDRREAVLGSFAARKLGLRVGDRFHPAHGMSAESEEKHEEEYVVVGVMEPSNTPGDRVVWVPLAAIQKMSGHDPRAATDVSAVLVKLRTAQAGFRLDMKYNKEDRRLTWAWPVAQVLAQLFDKVGWFDRVLQWVSWLVAGVAGASLLASLHNSLHERRREIAILRALGAHRATVFAAFVLEAVAITTTGLIAGWFLHAALFAVAASMIRAETGVVLDWLAWSPAYAWVPIVMLTLGALAGLAPGWKAYRTDVAENLVPLS